MTERQKGEKEARINIPASKLRGSCLRSSNVSNDTDKSFTNNLNADAVSDDAKQQTVVLSTENNSDIISRALISPPDESNGQLNVTGVSFTSSPTKKQNLYRSRENLSLIDSEEVDDDRFESIVGFVDEVNAMVDDSVDISLDIDCSVEADGAFEDSDVEEPSGD